jgi:glycosyltransferase involved in cell wall biosynthesis
LQLKLLGKKTFFHFRGGELRDRQKFAEVSPFAYSYEKDSDALFGNQSDDCKRLMKKVISELCTDVFVVDNELATYLPGAKIMPRAVDLSDWPFIGPTNRDRPLVIHAPSRRAVKGTDYILKAVDELKAKGVEFDFRLVEGLSNTEARELYKQADIVIDQLRIGWYGVLAVEAMALGKTVIAYIREDLLQVEENTLPLINANPNTIKDILEQTINDGPLRERLSFEAREYVERVHGSEAVCIRLLEAYKTPNHRDLGHSLLDLQEHQNHQSMLKGSAALLKKIDDGQGPIPTTSKARFRLARRIIKASLRGRN